MKTILTICLLSASLFSTMIDMSTDQILTVVENARKDVTLEESAYKTYRQFTTEHGYRLVVQSLTTVDTQFTDVINYGNFIRDNSELRADSLTILTDQYWKCHAIMSTTNPSIFQSRFFALMRDGQINRAQYIRLFMGYNTSSDDENNQYLLNTTANWFKSISNQKQHYINTGIEAHDDEKYDSALENYIVALLLAPNDAHALYEIGFSFMMNNMQGHHAAINDTLIPGVEADSRASDFYQLARESDPLYIHAYQGNRDDFANGKYAIAAKGALDSLLTNGLNRHDLSIFAENCFVMKEYELAAYSYKFLLVLQLSDTHEYEDITLEKYITCIESFNAMEAAEFIKEQFSLLRQSLISNDE